MWSFAHADLKKCTLPGISYQRPRSANEGKDAWISYDTLYVDGVAVKGAK